MKRFKLLGPEGKPYWSETPGTLGGNAAARIYGKLTCGAALRALRRSPAYAKNRVFFASEEDAISAGFRPCGICMRKRLRQWEKAQRLEASADRLGLTFRF